MDQDERKHEKLSKLMELVDKSDISSIKSVVSGIIEVINDPESGAGDLEGIIEVDPPLTSKVLMLANSPYYGCRRKISEIEQAAVWVGFDALKELALRQKVSELFNTDESIEGYSRILLWKHSVAVALLGKMIYREEFGQRGENIYTAGLLHDIGVIAEDQFFPDDFKDILRKSKNERKGLAVVECEILGYNHAEIGKTIADHWNYPQELVTAIGYHHNPGGVDQEFSKIVSTLYVADYLCQKNGIGYSNTSFKDETVFQECLSRLEVELYALDLIVEDMKQEISKMEDQGLF